MSASQPVTDRVRVRAPGKVNLALRVGAVREDGYPPLATVFQALSIFDELGAHPAAAECSVTRLRTASLSTLIGL